MTTTERDATTDQPVPRRVLEHLTTGFACHEADWLLRCLQDDGYDDDGYDKDKLVLMGDPFGRVLAWAWQESPDWATQMMVTYMAELRHDNARLMEGAPRLRFDDVLRSLWTAMPDGFGETEQLVAYLREHVPNCFASDLND